MKRIAPLMGCLTLLACLGSTSVAFFGTSSGRELQQRFFGLVAEENAAELQSQMHPELRDKIDSPVLSELLAVFNEKLGPITSIRQTGFNISVDADGKWLRTEATITCQKGTVRSKLATLDGRLVHFNLNSEKLDDWLRSPRDTSSYEHLGEAFLGEFMEGDSAAAWKMFHPNLQEVVSKKSLAEMVEQVTGVTGKLTEIEATGTRVKSGGQAPTLLIDYRLTCERIDKVGEIEIQFDGMKGYLLGFRVY